MRTAEWILTFDDGPLPADVTDFEKARADGLLDPLKRIVATLHEHLPEPVPAVFFLRGPGYPWRRDNKPPKRLFREGVALLEQAGHSVALHCYRHEPDLWWNWWRNERRIRSDLDRCLAYFAPISTRPLTLFRPPYGQGGPVGVAWARENGIRHRLWDIDTEDWLHHPDGEEVFRRFRRKRDAGQHLDHIRAILPWRMAVHTVWPGPNDFLLHVSERTAAHLPAILDAIVECTHLRNHKPRFVVPEDYLRP